MSQEKLTFAFMTLLIIQCVHSVEELSTGFHKKWYLFRMPFFVFFLFEVSFIALWIVVFKNEIWQLMNIFNILMFLNGMQHIIWACVARRYVPGLITAPLFVFVFLGFYLLKL